MKIQGIEIKNSKHIDSSLDYIVSFKHPIKRAQDAAMIYSLFATCRLHNVNPEKWLTYLLQNINSTTKENLHLLLPQNYTQD